MDIIDVATGQLAVARSPARLRVNALGSCVAVVMHDHDHKIGGIAHVMLPSTEWYLYGDETLKYADVAVPYLVRILISKGAAAETLYARLIGGANLISDTIDIGRQNSIAIQEQLLRLRIRVAAERLGGSVRRKVTLYIENGAAFVGEDGRLEQPM